MIASRTIAIIAPLLSLCVSASAADPMQAEPIGMWEMAKVSAGLLVVIAVIVASAAGLKRLKAMHSAHGSHMRIIDGISVSTRDRVVLLEVGQQRLLLGVSPGRIETLHVLSAGPATQPPFVEMVERAAEQQRGGDAL